MTDSFDTRSTLKVADKSYEIFNPAQLPQAVRLPYSLKILLENLLRHEDGATVTHDDIEALLSRRTDNGGAHEIAYRPARVLMQDFTGIPALVDLAAMRAAMRALDADPGDINPLQPAELVIDHSVQVDHFGSDDAFDLNTRIEFQRNRERYEFLKWGQKAFSRFKVVPPGLGIVHQVNIEFLARVIFADDHAGVGARAYPDTLVGTDSHTTMVNGIGVLGWGVGGIEAEASMLGQPISMLVPRVVGFRLHGELPEGATATDLVLTVVQTLREHGAVGKFVEFYGDGLDHLSPGDRATIANMAPEYGATCGIFAIDEQTLAYLRMTGRSSEHVALIEAYAKETGLWRRQCEGAVYDEALELDLASVAPSLAGPRRPQDRVKLHEIKSQFGEDLPEISGRGEPKVVPIEIDGRQAELKDGAVVIAAITSCTNTSNPSVMLAAGLLAKKAAARGLTVKPWVKTSLAPGSRAVTGYLEHAGVMDSLKSLGFHVVGYGCTTCIGNSGPLPEAVAKAVADNDLVAVSVLSGNRNFEGRVHAQIRMNYLASPPLVVAYALAGRMDFNPYEEPLAENVDGRPVYLKDVWPTRAEVIAVENKVLLPERFSESYADIYAGDDNWRSLEAEAEQLFAWPDSTYIAHPPYFEDISMKLSARGEIMNARVLAYLGDSVTTDHISPAGAIAADSPAGRYLQEHGIAPVDFNSYGSRRGNHEIMMRGTFANIRLRNRLVPGVEGGYTLHLPDGEQMAIYDAAMRYREEGVPTIILAGKEYGSGSSRDWAAKGPHLQGVRTVIAESFERIHRSNLVGMGILPLQYTDGENAASLGLSGHEMFDITGFDEGNADTATVTARDGDAVRMFGVKVRIDTPREVDYYRHGGILHYVLRQLAADSPRA